MGVAVITSEVRMLALGAQARPLLHAEAVLLVDDDEAEAPELDALLDEGVRAHRARDLPGGEGRAARRALARLEGGREQRHLGRRGARAAGERS